MELADRTRAVWQVFRADSQRAARLRRRVGGIGAMVAFLLALLATVGFLRIVLVVLAAVAVGACVVPLLLVVGRYGTQLGPLTTAVVRRARSVGSSLAVAVSSGTCRLVRSVSHGVVATRRNAKARLPQLRVRYAHFHGAAGRQVAAATTRMQRRARATTSHRAELRNHYARLQAAAGRQIMAATTQAQRHVHTATTAVGGRRDGWPMRTPVAREGEALRANAAGAQLRRDGSYVEAAEQHRIALELYRELGDRRSEALTLNNLALPLDRSGDSGALALFEQAAATLGELGEEQEEGEVIANLALAFRRRGSDERSAEVLEIALGKLNPESQAYQKVEGLRRAS